MSAAPSPTRHDTRSPLLQGLVVVLPLVDMDMVNGPTEYMTGSHVNLVGTGYMDLSPSPSALVTVAPDPPAHLPPPAVGA